MRPPCPQLTVGALGRQGMDPGRCATHRPCPARAERSPHRGPSAWVTHAGIRQHARALSSACIRHGLPDAGWGVCQPSPRRIVWGRDRQGPLTHLSATERACCRLKLGCEGLHHLEWLGLRVHCRYRLHAVTGYQVQPGEGAQPNPGECFGRSPPQPSSGPSKGDAKPQCKRVGCVSG